MEDPSSLSSPKLTKSCNTTQCSTGGKAVRGGQPQPVKLYTEQRGHGKEQSFVRKVQELISDDTKDRVPAVQGLAPSSAKESKKPPSFRLHTQERAARRAGFNHLVASKISTLEILRRFEEKIQKVIEEEEIKMMRKEMVPKAQLMPIFDRPFLPQRSRRPPTTPKEPNFHFTQNLKAIK